MRTRAGAAIAAAMIAVVGVSMPAQAATSTFSADDALWGLGCTIDGNLAVRHIDPVAQTELSVHDTGIVTDSCDSSGQIQRLAGAYDPVRDVMVTSYQLNQQSYLAELDRSTGELGTPVRITGVTDSAAAPADTVDSLYITPAGVAFATNANDLYEINLVTGEAQYIETFDSIGIYFLAGNYRGGTVYLVQDVGSSGMLSTINLDTGEVTNLGTYTKGLELDMGLNSALVDASGTLWFDLYHLSDAQNRLEVVDLSAEPFTPGAVPGADPVSGMWTFVANENGGKVAVFIAPGPGLSTQSAALASTGVAPTAVSALAIAAFAVGGLLVMRRRAMRARSAHVQ